MSRGNGRVTQTHEFEPSDVDDNSGADYRFKLIPFNAIKLSNKSRYLVKGLIPREALIVVWGPPKCGKSFWTFDLLMHVALGWDYRGRRVEAGTCIYVACEGEHGLAARAEAFRQAKIAEEGAEPPFYLLTTRLDLIADVDALAADISAQLAGEICLTIVVDTLNRSLVGSESRDEDMAAYIKAADHLREKFRCAVIIVHHCGINDARPRGHTSLSGAADAQISIKRDAAENVVAELELMKDGPAGAVSVSRLVPVEVDIDEDGEPITSCIIEPLEEGAQKRSNKPRLSPSQGRALQLLGAAIDKGGEIPPASNHIPTNTRCVNESLWRDYCYKGAISDGAPGSKQKAFKRAALELVAAERVGKWDPWVWIVP